MDKNYVVDDVKLFVKEFFEETDLEEYFTIDRKVRHLVSDEDKVITVQDDMVAVSLPTDPSVLFREHRYPLNKDTKSQLVKLRGKCHKEASLAIYDKYKDILQSFEGVNPKNLTTDNLLLIASKNHLDDDMWHKLSEIGLELEDYEYRLRNRQSWTTIVDVSEEGSGIVVNMSIIDNATDEVIVTYHPLYINNKASLIEFTLKNMMKKF